MATANWCETSTVPQLGRSPLVAKFERFVSLAPSDVAALEFLCGEVRRLPGQHVIVERGELQNDVAIILRGLAIRYRSLPGGSRQILGYLASGDLSDPFCVERKTVDHSVMLLGEAQVATVPISVIRAIAKNHPPIERALLLMAMAEQAILREWLLNIGQRSAYEKLSHLFCEMAIRLTAAGQANRDGSVDLPLTQTCLADTTGLTHIHVNRILKRLRANGLVIRNKRLLTIPDIGRLVAAADFERDYLDPLKAY